MAKNPGSIKDRNATCDLVCLEAKGGWESNLGKSCGMLALCSPAAVWRQAVMCDGSLVLPNMTITALPCPLLKKHPVLVSSALRPLNFRKLWDY